MASRHAGEAAGGGLARVLPPEYRGSRLLGGGVPELGALAIAAAAIASRGLTMDAGLRAALASTLLLVALVDAATLTIPIRLLAVGTLLALAERLASGGPQAATALAVGFACAMGLALLGVGVGRAAGRPALGVADVPLVGLLGLALAPEDIWGTILLAAAAGVALVLLRSTPRDRRLPLGAALAIALVAAAAMGRELELGAPLLLLTLARARATDLARPVPFGACMAAAAIPRLLL